MDHWAVLDATSIAANGGLVNGSKRPSPAHPVRIKNFIACFILALYPESIS
jgi:hypothetical protein